LKYSFKKYFSDNKYKFDKILNNVLDEENIVRKVQLCSQASSFAVLNPIGVFNSKILEETLVDIAKKHSIKNENYKPNSFLHVFSVCYTSGGHTRVCERWIKASPKNQKHSIVLLSQGNREVPESLKDIVSKKSGEFVEYKNKFPLEKALDLRKLASKYEYIILHVHMHDIVPILAFGTDEFKRPVILYNHADHLFWLGCSIADLVVNFRSLGKDVNKKRRNIRNNFILPLPVEDIDNNLKEENTITKKDLGFSKNSKVIITIASSYKYRPIDGIDFVKTAKRILEKDKDIVIIAIGPSKKEKYWRDAFNETNGRINAIGVVPYSLLHNYLKIADLALESFPYGSPTGLLDIARYNIPCVSLRGVINIMDTFDEANIVCSSQDELIKKVYSLLKENNSLENNLYKIMKRDHFPKGFSKKLLSLYNIFPKEHKINEVIQDNEKEKYEFEKLIVQNKSAENKQVKAKIINLIRKIIYLYVQYVFPKGMSYKLFDFLSSRGLM